jgi:hypothetical protein
MSTPENTCLIDNFDQLAVENGKRQLRPFSGRYEKKDFYFLLTHEKSHYCNEAVKAIGDTFSCRRCQAFTQNVAIISDEQGQILLPSDLMKLVEDDMNKDLYQKAHQALGLSCKELIDGIRIFRKESYLFDYQPHDSEKEFLHFHITVPENFRTELNNLTCGLLEGAFRRYIVQGQMDRLICRLITQGKASCEILEKILDRVHYGNTFLPALRWAMNILDDLGSETFDHMSERNRYLFLFKHLVNQKISGDLYSGAVSFSCQTLNQLVGLMECANNEEAMTKLVEERLSPLNYQRPTADPSEGQVAEAMRHLGDFSISVAKISDHSNAVPVGIENKSNEFSALSGFEALKLSAQQSKKPESFADRCGGSKTSRIKAITTCQDLVAYCREHPEAVVKVDTLLMSLLYYANNTLGDDFLCVPFTWSFQTGFGASKWNITSDSKVTHIIPGYERTRGTKWENILFVCEGGVLPSDTKVNTFPEFLNSEYRRTCGSAFEALKNTMKLGIPSGEPLAFGIGTSSSDERGGLHTPINLTIDGVSCKITHI